MNSILFLTLLCPDSGYFREPFPVRIEKSEPAPPGTSFPDAWEARSGLAGIVGEGYLPKGADSFTVTVAGPGRYLEVGARVSLEIGTFDSVKGQIKPLPGVSCSVVMKVRPGVGVKAQARGRVLGAWPEMRIDGRVL